MNRTTKYVLPWGCATADARMRGPGDRWGAEVGERRTKVRNGPLGREAYFNAAMKILASAGFQELTVDNLSAELGATKGSFYHHFTGMPEFTEALVAAWQARVSEICTQMAALPPLEGLARSMEMIGQWPLQADAALRAWAWANPVVAAAVARHEATWERLMLTWMSQVVPDPERARVLAHMILAVLTGMLQLQRVPEAELIRAVSLEFLRSNIGIEILPDATYRALDATTETSPVRTSN
jgi:AcrR family transcriptional regulator